MSKLYKVRYATAASLVWVRAYFPTSDDIVPPIALLSNRHCLVEVAFQLLEGGYVVSVNTCVKFISKEEQPLNMRSPCEVRLHVTTFFGWRSL
jgi:hypothetical protein